MRFCFEKDGRPVFGTDKITGRGYCKSHQYLRTDTDKRTALQKALAKNDADKPHKELRFPQKQKPTKKGWFDLQAAFEDNEPKTSLPTTFTPSREQVNAANDVVKEFKLGERGKSELWDWFLDRREEMVGFCANCNNKSLKDNDRLFQNSVCHVLPKSVIKSVATHPSNFIELCQNCHNDMDNHIIDLIDMACFDTIIEKVVKMYPSIAKDEIRRIPPIIREYIKTELL